MCSAIDLIGCMNVRDRMIGYLSVDDWMIGYLSVDDWMISRMIDNTLDGEVWFSRVEELLVAISRTGDAAEPGESVSHGGLPRLVTN